MLPSQTRPPVSQVNNHYSFVSTYPWELHLHNPWCIPGILTSTAWCPCWSLASWNIQWQIHQQRWGNGRCHSGCGSPSGDSWGVCHSLSLVHLRWQRKTQFQWSLDLQTFWKSLTLWYSSCFTTALTEVTIYLKQIPPIGLPSLMSARVLCLGSNTSLVMYSFGIRGSWCENTFCKEISHSIVCFGTYREKRKISWHKSNWENLRKIWISRMC